MESFTKKILANVNGVEKEIRISTNLYSPLPYGFDGSIVTNQKEFEDFNDGDIISFNGFESVVVKKEREFLESGKVFVKC